MKRSIERRESQRDTDKGDQFALQTDPKEKKSNKTQHQPLSS
jgi:hypothetical protein